jgi:hypothetical protein
LLNYTHLVTVVVDAPTKRVGHFERLSPRAGRWPLLPSWPRGVISIDEISNRNRSCSGYEREEEREEERGAAMPSRIVGLRF